MASITADTPAVTLSPTAHDSMSVLIPTDAPDEAFVTSRRWQRCNRHWVTTSIKLSFAFMAPATMDRLFFQYIPVMLQAGSDDFEQLVTCTDQQSAFDSIAGFGLSPLVAYIVLSWDNLLAAVISAFAGKMSDGCYFKYLGRRKPFLILGYTAACIAFVLVPQIHVLGLLMVALAVRNVGASIAAVQQGAWIGDLIEAPKRSHAHGVILVMTVISIGFVLVYASILVNNLGMVYAFLVVGSCSYIYAWIPVLTVQDSHIKPRPKEAKPQEEAPGEPKPCIITRYFRQLKKGFLALYHQPGSPGLWFLGGIVFGMGAITILESGIVPFGIFNLGFSAGKASMYTTILAVAFLVSLPLASRPRTSHGRWQCIRLGLFIALVTCVGAYFLIWKDFWWPKPLLVTTMALLGIAGALTVVNMLPLTFDMYGADSDHGCDYGLISGLENTCTATGKTFAPLLVGAAAQFTFERSEDCDENWDSWVGYRLVWLLGGIMVALGWLFTEKAYRGHKRQLQQRAEKAEEDAMAILQEDPVDLYSGKGCDPPNTPQQPSPCDEEKLGPDCDCDTHLHLPDPKAEPWPLTPKGPDSGDATATIISPLSIPSPLPAPALMDPVPLE